MLGLNWLVEEKNKTSIILTFVLFGCCFTDLFYVVIRVRGDPEKVRPVFHPATYNSVIFVSYFWSKNHHIDPLIVGKAVAVYEGGCYKREQSRLKSTGAQIQS